MKNSSFKKAVALSLSTLLVTSLSFAQVGTGPTQGTWGFDWIGSSNASAVVHDVNAVCHKTDATGQVDWLSPVTSWVAGGQSGAQYSPNVFSVLMGVSPYLGGHGYETPLPPQDVSDYVVYIWDSFESFRANPFLNYRAKFTFSRPFNANAVTFTPHSNNTTSCGSNLNGCTNNLVPTYKAVFRLNYAQASYKDTNGNPTIIPYRFTSGTRYWIGFAGLNYAQVDGTPCIVRARSSLDARYISPMPSPAVSYPMTPQQCADGEMTYPCSFTLNHSEFYKINPNAGIGDGCAQSASSVNWTSSGSTIAPLWSAPNTTGPRRCGYPNGQACCERTFPGRLAYGMQVSPALIIKNTSNVQHAVAVACDFPDC